MSRGVIILRTKEKVVIFISVIILDTKEKNIIISMGHDNANPRHQRKIFIVSRAIIILDTKEKYLLYPGVS